MILSILLRIRVELKLVNVKVTMKRNCWKVSQIVSLVERPFLLGSHPLMQAELCFFEVTLWLRWEGGRTGSKQ